MTTSSIFTILLTLLILVVFIVLPTRGKLNLRSPKFMRLLIIVGGLCGALSLIILANLFWTTQKWEYVYKMGLPISILILFWLQYQAQKKRME